MSFFRHPFAVAGGLLVGGALLGAGAVLAAFKMRDKVPSAVAPPLPILSKVGAPLEPEVADKLVLVTGSSAGIGKAVAEAYARAGARVLVNGRTEESVAKAVAAIQAVVGSSLAGNVLPLVGDVGSAGEFDCTLTTGSGVCPLRPAKQNSDRLFICPRYKRHSVPLFCFSWNLPLHIRRF